MNFVPTPDGALAGLRARLNLPDGVVALDPCCGTGDALARLCPGGSTYGIELDVGRGAAAKSRLSHVLIAAMQDCRVANNVFGLALLNPPYDASLEGRLEFTMLERTTRMLAFGGVLVYIIKSDRYSPEILEHLSRHYTEFAHWRFDDAEFGSYGQTLLLARRGSGLRESTTTLRGRLRLQDDEGNPSLPPTMADGDVVWDVPKGKPVHTFLALEVSEPALAALLAASPLARCPAPPRALDVGRPPLPLKKGHLALVLASGACNGVYGDGAKRHVAKGSVRRVELEEEEHDVTAGGNDVLIRRRTYTFEVVIRCITRDGKIHDVAGSPPAKHEDGGEEDAKE